MNKYELAIIFDPKLDEDAYKAEFEVVTGYVVKFGGEIDKVDDWGKRRLAYEINKATEGIYNFIAFSAPGSAPAEIESRVRLRENVLRYLIFRQDD